MLPLIFFALVALVVVASDHARMLAELISLRLQIANADRRLAKLTREHDQLTRAYSNQGVLLDIRTQQRDQTRRDLEVERTQLRADLSELSGDRDKAERKAEEEKARREEAEAALRVLVTSSQQGSFCNICGQRADMCSSACARFIAAGLVAPASTVVAEA